MQNVVGIERVHLSECYIFRFAFDRTLCNQAHAVCVHVLPMKKKAFRLLHLNSKTMMTTMMMMPMVKVLISMTTEPNKYSLCIKRTQEMWSDAFYTRMKNVLKKTTKIKITFALFSLEDLL